MTLLSVLGLCACSRSWLRAETNTGDVPFPMVFAELADCEHPAELRVQAFGGSDRDDRYEVEIEGHVSDGGVSDLRVVAWRSWVIEGLSGRIESGRLRIQPGDSPAESRLEGELVIRFVEPVENPFMVRGFGFERSTLRINSLLRCVPTLAPRLEVCKSSANQLPPGTRSRCREWGVSSQP